MILPAILILAFVLQLYFIFWALTGLRKLLHNQSRPNEKLREYSVIIAAHNEAETIAACLKALTLQTYPPDLYEIIIAADRCEDATVAMAESYKDEFANIHILKIDSVPEDVSPKKHALAEAVKHAKFDHYLFLDADVKPTRRHIETMNRYFKKNTAAVVSLMKFKHPEAFLHRFLAFEKLISWCIAGAGIGYQRPIISYGGNWGYTKNAFRKAGGFSSIDTSLSGDDDLLLQKMGAHHLPVAFCLEADGWIRTYPPESFSHFIRQRRRHFSAGKNYRPALQAAYLLHHGSNLLLWIGWLFYPPALLLLGIKLLLDLIVLRKGSQIFQEKINFGAAIIFDFLYLIYNTVIGPLGHIGKIKW